MIFVNRLLLFKVRIIGSELAMRVIRSLVGEDLGQSDRDVVVLTAEELETFRSWVHHRDSSVVIVLELFHPRTLKCLILSKEVCLPCKAISCLTEADHKTIIKLLLDAVIHATIEDIVNESIGKDESNVPLSHVLAQEVLRLLRVVTRITTALVWEVMRLLLGRRPEVHFKRVIFFDMEKRVA